MGMCGRQRGERIGMCGRQRGERMGMCVVGREVREVRRWGCVW